MELANVNNYMSLIRPNQYIKNLFVFAPLLFTFDYSVSALIQAFVVFILFSLAASGIYIFNDLTDIEEDQRHPVKQHRALASGLISKGNAAFLMVGLSSVSLIISYLVQIDLFFVILIYTLLNIAYSVKLKHIVLIDIFIIASGFVLRIFAGAFAINVNPSMWIIIMTFLLALFLAIAKRRDDIVLSQKGKLTRRNIDGYNIELVNATMVMMAAVIIVSYIIYTISPEVTSRMHSEKLYLTVFFVILGIMRYMQLTFVEERSGSPTKIVLTDRFIQLTLFFWFASFLAVAMF